MGLVLGVLAWWKEVLPFGVALLVHLDYSKQDNL
jgi:hypothetical protein